MQWNQRDRVAESRCGRLVAVAVFGGLGVAASAHAQVFFETHSFNHHLDLPQPSTTYETTFALPRFDTMGGTRELLGFFEAYDMSIDGQGTMGPNNTADTLHGQLRWGVTWRGVIDGDGTPFFPAHDDFGSNPLEIGGAAGGWLAPFEPEWPIGIGGGVSLERLVDDPSKLSALTGVGDLDLDSIVRISDFMSEPITSPRLPDGAVYDPNLVSAEWTSFDLFVDIRYVYQVVPAPGALGWFALAGLGVAHGRRRAPHR